MTLRIIKEYVSIPNSIDSAKLKQNMKVFRGKLRLIRHFRYNEKILDFSKMFRLKSTFNLL